MYAWYVQTKWQSNVNSLKVDFSSFLSNANQVYHMLPPYASTVQVRLCLVFSIVLVDFYFVLIFLLAFTFVEFINCQRIYWWYKTKRQSNVRLICRCEGEWNIRGTRNKYAVHQIINIDVLFLYLARFPQTFQFYFCFRFIFNFDLPSVFFVWQKRQTYNFLGITVCYCGTAGAVKFPATPNTHCIT